MMQEDIELLQGSWSIASLTMNGQEMPDNLYPNARLEIRGNRFTGVGMGAEYEGALELDTSADPKQLDMKFDTGPEKGNVNLCIYEVAGDVWKLCIATKGSERPSDFVSKPGSGVAVEVLRRLSLIGKTVSV